MRAALGKKSKTADHLRNKVSAYLSLQREFAHKCGGMFEEKRRGRGEKRSLNQNKKYQCGD